MTELEGYEQQIQERLKATAEQQKMIEGLLAGGALRQAFDSSLQNKPQFLKLHQQPLAQAWGGDYSSLQSEAATVDELGLFLPGSRSKPTSQVLTWRVTGRWVRWRWWSFP